MPEDTSLLVKSAVRRRVNAAGKRVSPEFLDGLETHVKNVIDRCIGQHNGGVKTLDLTILGFVTRR